MPTSAAFALVLTLLGAAEEPAPARFALTRLEPVDAPPLEPSALAKQRAVALAWTALDCPMAKLYLSRLKALAAELAPQGVTFLLIDSQAGDTRADLVKAAAEAGLGFAAIHDRGGELARRFGVERTTEALVLVPCGGERAELLYRGAVDDQYGYRRTREGGVGTYRREAPERQYLREALAAVLAGRRPDPARSDALGCPLDLAPAPESDAAKAESAAAPIPSFDERIEPLLQKHCQDCHHRGGPAPFALESYEDAARRARRIHEVVAERRMPPWNADPRHGTFANDPTLPDAAVEDILRWARAGAPRGDPARAPPPRRFSEGFWFGEPDTVFRTPPFDVPAEGQLPYRYVRLKNESSEDRWVEAADIRSSAGEAVHHVLIFLENVPPPLPGSAQPYRPPFNPFSLLQGAEPNEYRSWIRRFRRYIGRDFLVGEGGGLNGYFLTTTAGARGLDYPAGRAKLLPAGATLVFQIHYTPLGRAIAGEVTSLALRFAKAPPKEAVDTRSIATVVFEIPPGASDYRVAATYKLPRSGRLLSLQPHMHLRGKSFRYVARRPDGSEEILLSVPRYDFDWQLSYLLAEPMPLPEGTELRAEGVFDNSAANPYNPDPARRVFFGLQTEEEMMIGYFEIAWDEARPAAPASDR